MVDYGEVEQALALPREESLSQLGAAELARLLGSNGFSRTGWGGSPFQAGLRPRSSKAHRSFHKLAAARRRADQKVGPLLSHVSRGFAFLFWLYEQLDYCHSSDLVATRKRFVTTIRLPRLFSVRKPLSSVL